MRAVTRYVAVLMTLSCVATASQGQSERRAAEQLLRRGAGASPSDYMQVWTGSSRALFHGVRFYQGLTRLGGIDGDPVRVGLIATSDTMIVIRGPGDLSSSWILLRDRVTPMARTDPLTCSELLRLSGIMSST